MVIKAALKDQEKAGIEIVSGGELRRDNDLDYLLARASRLLRQPLRPAVLGRA
jgi:methionine synthase II (cobalamin-independent)